MPDKPYYITRTPCIFEEIMKQGPKHVNWELHRFLPDVEEAVIDTNGNIQVKSLRDKTLSEEDAAAIMQFLSWTREAGDSVSCNVFTTWPKICVHFDKKTGMCIDKDGRRSTYCQCMQEIISHEKQSQR